MGQAASRFDQGELFRTQAIRDISDIDTMLARKEQLRVAIGEQRANEIEKRPDTVIDGEGFRIAHAYGRWYGVIFTGATLFGGSTAYSMSVGVPGAGKQLLRQNTLFAVPAVVGMYCVYYQVFARIGGYSQQKWDEYKFARFCRQLRNAKMQQ